MRNEQFLEDLKTLIYNNFENCKIKSIEFKKGEDIADYLKGDEYVILTFENDTTKRINITKSSNIKIARDILFELS